jgi:hypothetical protein
MLNQTPLERWQSRALRAEHALFKAGLKPSTPADVWGDDEWLCVTFEHKDGSPVHVDQLNAARERVAAKVEQ